MAGAGQAGETMRAGAVCQSRQTRGHFSKTPGKAPRQKTFGLCRLVWRVWRGLANTGLQVCGQALDAAGGRGAWVCNIAMSRDFCYQPRPEWGGVNTCTAVTRYAVPDVGHTVLREESQRSSFARVRWRTPIVQDGEQLRCPA